MAVRDSDDDDDEEEEGEDRNHQVQEMEMEEEIPDPDCVGENPPSSGMNLATALAAERHLRATQDMEGGGNVEEPTSNSPPETPPVMTDTTSSVPGTPLTLRVSLMRLLEEEGDCVDEVTGDGDRDGEKGGGGAGGDGMCCVCMGRLLSPL